MASGKQMRKFFQNLYHFELKTFPTIEKFSYIKTYTLTPCIQFYKSNRKARTLIPFTLEKLRQIFQKN